MQHIRSYADKIEAIIASRTATKETKKRSKGLLAPSKGADASKERTQLEMIADIVQGIREAKEEILNARK